MKALTATQQKEHARIVGMLETQKSRFEEKLDDYNAAVRNLVSARTELEDAREQAETFRNEVAEALRSTYDARSEKWQDSDKGLAFCSVVEAWEDAEVDINALSHERNFRLYMSDRTLSEIDGLLDSIAFDGDFDRTQLCNEEAP